MTTPAPTEAAPAPPTGDVSATVRAELARRRMSGQHLATTVGMTQPAMSRRLRGQVPFTVEQLVRIARALDMPTAELLP